MTPIPNRTLASLGFRRGLPVQCHRRRGEQLYRKSSEPEPQVLAGRSRQRGPSDVRRLRQGRPGCRQSLVPVARWPVRRGLRRTGAVDGGPAGRSRRVPRAALQSPAGSPDALATTVASSSPTLSAGQASNRIAAAGALLRRADAQYDMCRRSLAAAVGHGRLPASVWVSDPQDWQVGTVAATVDLMATSARWPSPTISSCARCG